MYKVILFGGTTEGRKLADYCDRHQISALVCVVSDYGAELVRESLYVKVRPGAMEEQDMEELFCREKPELVIDSTHPYAAAVTENIRQACGAVEIPRIRITRDSQEEKGRGETVWVENAGEAADYLSERPGRVLFTTGTKDLPCFSHMAGFARRAYARVLPDEKALSLCRSLGLKGGQIIAMQGPFSFELNLAILNMTKASYLVTKESGAAGGFAEKLEAARAAGVRTVVIGRPKKEDGVTLKQAMKLLKGFGGSGRRKVFLAGIGMGGPGQLTQEVISCIAGADGVAGARRMVESAAELCEGKEIKTAYKPDEILRWLEENPELEQVAVLYSGDPGFYSGAGAMAELLRKHPENYETVILPGVSSVAFFCARLGMSWEDICLESLHGRQPDLEKRLKDHKKIFLLMGGKNSVSELCGWLVSRGRGHIQVSVGESLSYPEERIVVKTAEEMENQEFHGLCAVLLEDTL